MPRSPGPSWGGYFTEGSFFGEIWPLLSSGMLPGVGEAAAGAARSSPSRPAYGVCLELAPLPVGLGVWRGRGGRALGSNRARDFLGVLPG